MMIVLVGRHMDTATGIHKEIDMAKQQNVPFFGIYVDDANQYFNHLPRGLAENRIIHWRWENVSNAIDQMLNEGKNCEKSTASGY